MYIRKNRRYYITLTVCSICMALALTMNFAPGVEGSSGSIGDILDDMKNGFEGTAFITTLLSGMLIWCNYHIDRLKKDKLHVEIICFFLAIIWLMAESFSLDDTLSALHSSRVQCLKSIIYVVGSTYLLVQLAYLLRFLLDVSAIKGRDLPQTEVRLVRQYRKHPFGFPLVVFLVALFPQLVFSYPARMTIDAYAQLAQYFGVGTYAVHHPPASTWLMGKVVSFGLLFGNGNRAVFLYIAIQYLLLAVISAYLVYTIRIFFHAPRWLQITTILVTVLAPYHAAYVGVMVKDIIYAYAILLMEIELLYMLHSDFNFWKSGRHCILFWIAASLSILLRNNGRYVVYPTMAVLFISLFSKQNRRRIQREERIRCALLFMAVIVVSTAVLQCLNVRYGEKNGEIKEALSIPFQQTARYLKEYGTEVSKEEKEILSRVLDSEIADLYNPRISDPVKGTYRQWATAEDLKAYFKLWVRLFFRHPMSYIRATVNQNYVLIWPKEEMSSYWTEAVYEGYEPSMQLAEYMGIHEADSSVFQSFAELQDLYVGTAVLLPVWGMLSNIACYTLLLIFLFVFSVRSRLYRTLLALLPLLVSVLIVIAAPVVSVRYSLPFMYPMPAVLAMYLYEVREKQE